MAIFLWELTWGFSMATGGTLCKISNFAFFSSGTIRPHGSTRLMKIVNSLIFPSFKHVLGILDLKKIQVAKTKMVIFLWELTWDFSIATGGTLCKISSFAFFSSRTIRPHGSTSFIKIVNFVIFTSFKHI